MEIAAFILLRATLAWLFLAPVYPLLSNWKGTVNIARLLTSIKPELLSIAMMAVMIGGALSILLGFYAQIGAALLCAYCLLGAIVYQRSCGKIAGLQLSATANIEDLKTLNHAKAMGIVGNKTSAQKNIVLASIFLFIALMGSGPLSLTGNLF